MKLTIRRLADNSLIPVNIGALAIQIRGDIQIPNGGGTGETGAQPVNGSSPAVVIRCADRDDVLQCLDFASRQGLLLSMHNGPDETGWSKCDHGIAVDLRGLSKR
ncbi:MAG: hypothetical protein JJT90_03155 [Ectothiorhodospiraceae bacterium]|nr:hypothetical protein [Ectothiorhodospiraceae bacterium]